MRPQDATALILAMQRLADAQERLADSLVFLRIMALVFAMILFVHMVLSATGKNRSGTP